MERSVWLAFDIMVKALSGRLGTWKGIASPAMKPDRVLRVDSRLLINGRSGFLAGRSGFIGSDFIESLLDSLSKMWNIETIEGRLGRI
jgi:hypothetical protein